MLARSLFLNILICFSFRNTEKMTHLQQMFKTLLNEANIEWSFEKGNTQLMRGKQSLLIMNVAHVLLFSINDRVLSEISEKITIRKSHRTVYAAQ